MDLVMLDINRDYPRFLNRDETRKLILYSSQDRLCRFNLETNLIVLKIGLDNPPLKSVYLYLA